MKKMFVKLEIIHMNRKKTESTESATWKEGIDLNSFQNSTLKTFYGEISVTECRGAEGFGLSLDFWIPVRGSISLQMCAANV